MHTSRQLSRLLITGPIHDYTPLCVLIDIADAHGIKYNPGDQNSPNFVHHLIESIHQTAIPNIGEIRELAEWQYIARFVNKHSQWPQGRLMQAYNFLVGFMNNEDPLTKIPENFNFGPQTPTNIISVNACILYKICVHHRLNINFRTTIDQMVNAVSLLRDDLESVIRRAMIFIEKDAKRIDLINALMLSPYVIQDPNPPEICRETNLVGVPVTKTSHEMLRLLHNQLNDIRSLQQKIEPSTNDGSVALAAINYCIDISKSADPRREYKILKMSGRNEYKPWDPWMKYWYEHNPSLFDLTVTFNRLFPSNYYDNNHMIAMAHNEGHTSNDVLTVPPYELLQIVCLTETFYMGEMPDMKSTQTPISLDDISEIPYGELLCYGQLDSLFQPISMSELIDLFNTNQNFTNPFHRDSVFTDIVINKLKIIAQSPNGPIPSKRVDGSTIIIRNNLLDAIVGVEIISKANDEPTRQFGSTYRNASPDTKVAIVSTLITLLDTGMYMRGWNGPGSEYPIIKASVPPERELAVAISVTDALANYDKGCRSLGKIGVQINNLPLVMCRDGKYIVSNRDDDGRTIGQRITIVKDGDGTSNIASCIRLSSNWICASAHKYLTALGRSPPFDIFTLRHIS